MLFERFRRAVKKIVLVPKGVVTRAEQKTRPTQVNRTGFVGGLFP